MKKLIFLFALFTSLSIFAQNDTKSVGQGIYLGKSEPLRDFPLLNGETKGKTTLKIIPNNFPVNGYEGENSLPTGEDSVRQSAFDLANRQFSNLGVNFDGINRDEASNAIPPDPTGAVGPNHYVNGVNIAIKVFDKSGNLLAGPTSLGNFIGDNQESGDPIIMYDQLADRWFVSQFNTTTDGLAIAISETPDPTGAYFLYEFPLDSFPDYPHYSVWHDAYYLTANKAGETIYALERDVMIAGGANPQILGFTLPGVIANPNSVFSPASAYLSGTDFDPNTPGYITYLQDDAWNGVSNDHLKVWELDIDFTNPSNSTISDPLEIPVAPFDSFFAQFGTGELDQPGTTQRIDMITGVISYAAHYRPFADHNSWLVTFNVDVESNNEIAGIRWIELRNSDTDDWSLYQEGTYSPADGFSRFMGSGAIDAQGNIGLAFNIGRADTPVGIAYTGRFENDPLGQMTVVEETIVSGVGVQTITNRFGDYSQLSMDPNGFSFWNTSEYFTSNDNWSTRVTEFSLTNNLQNDVGITAIITPVDGALTANEVITVNVRNFGTEVQTDIPIQLSVDDLVVANEVFSGPIPANGILPYSFTQTVDMSLVGQTYVIDAKTNLVGDEFEPNDDASKTVTHLLPNDIGVTDLVAPASGSNLSNTETVTITVTNFGSEDQADFPVNFTFNGEPTVTETFTGTLTSGTSVDYTFTETVDLSEFDDYTLDACTALVGDQDTTNDCLGEQIISNILCQPLSSCSGFGFNLGVTTINLANQGFDTECSASGYSDNSDIIFDFELNNNPFDGVLQVGFMNTSYAIWIDFNDNNVFENDELISTGLVADGDSDFNFTLDFSTIATVTNGMHKMRIKGGLQGQDILDPCGDIQFGRTNDYTANITGNILSIEEQAISNGGLVVTTLEDNRFDVQFTTQFDGSLFLSVYNVLGQQLKIKPIAKTDSGYGVLLDMNTMPTGVYLLRLGSGNPKTFKTARVLVK